MRHAKHERTEFYFHHTFSSNHNHDMRRTHAINRGYLTKQQADFHSLQLDAKLGIHQKYKYKLPNTLQLRRAAGLRRLYPSTCARCSERGDS